MHTQSHLVSLIQVVNGSLLGTPAELNFWKIVWFSSLGYAMYDFDCFRNKRRLLVGPNSIQCIEMTRVLSDNLS